MVMTDPIADMLTRIRNANMVEKKYTDIPSSKMKIELAKILKEEGFIKEYKLLPDVEYGLLRVYLKYGPNLEKVITGLKRVSKPGCRVYARAKEIPEVFNKLGIMIVSTSYGLKSGVEAKKLNLGGELICSVW